MATFQKYPSSGNCCLRYLKSYRLPAWRKRHGLGRPLFPEGKNASCSAFAYLRGPPPSAASENFSSRALMPRTASPRRTLHLQSSHRFPNRTATSNFSCPAKMTSHVDIDDAVRSSATGIIGPSAPIPWPGREEFLNLVRHRPTDTNTITVCNAPVDEIQAFLEWIEVNKTVRCTLLFYDSQTQDGIFRVPSFPHDTAGDVFTQQIIMIIVGQGLTQAIQPRSTVRIQSVDGTKLAEPDLCLFPDHRLQEEFRFPSVMVEIGKSQSFPSLMRVMRGWFYMSGGKVKIVITIDIRQRPSGRHEMVFQKWRCPSLNGDPVCDTDFAITLRDNVQMPTNRQRLPHSDFVIQISPYSQPLPMVLEFDLVCDRAPGPGEGDILLPEPFFREIAAHTWQSF